MLSPGKHILSLAVAISLAGALPGLAQEPNSPADEQSTGWHKFADADAPAAPVPSTLTLPAGTWIKARVDQTLSSDQNRQGDGFTATLSQPLVANGLVIARKGQTVAGRVAEAEKAGRGKGTSRLGFELTELGLVDGRQVPIHTRLIEYSGGTSHGRDAGTIVMGTGLGAAIGAAAEGTGFGAGIGAIAGAAAASVAVLATRGKPTVVYPEAELTFRLEEPLTVSTENSQVAFQPVRPEDYEPQRTLRQSSRAAAGPPPPPPYYYWNDWYWDPFYYPGFYGPSFYFSTGPRFFGGRGFRHR